MLSAAVARSLPYSAEQLFDLAADIERYPQFLRWWTAATIRERSGQYCRVENTVALGPMRLQFTSAATLLRPERIDVRSTEAPFRRFDLGWRFEPQPEGSCCVRLTVTLQLRSFILQQLIEQYVQGFMGEILLAFEARARALYVGQRATNR